MFMFWAGDGTDMARYRRDEARDFVVQQEKRINIKCAFYI